MELASLVSLVPLVSVPLADGTGVGSAGLRAADHSDGERPSPTAHVVAYTTLLHITRNYNEGVAKTGSREIHFAAGRRGHEALDEGAVGLV
ncbi:hypothetical protein, partial [Streptomyces sp. NPDC007070]|uniref:hypothetical protein n=1 Tax=Streptomyces sp. NPDC007070 TaxID=3154312 RepID=UPI0033C6F75C